MIRTLPITKAREELTTLVDKARKLLDEYIITVNGSPAAVLMSAAEYESWKETIEILSDKKLMRSIKEGEEDFKKGNFVTFEQLKKSHQYAILSAFEEIKEDPLIGKPLTRELTGRFSYRVGVYRVIYKINQKDQIIQVLSAGHRA